MQKVGSLHSGSCIACALECVCQVHFLWDLIQVYITPASSGAAGEFAIDNVCVQQYLLTGIGR